MRMAVSKAKQDALLARMAKLDMRESDIEERFVLGAGRGGQKVNKTSSCVVLQHVGSGLIVRCQKTRSRALNRYFARVRLCEKLLERLDRERSERARQIARVRRQKKRRSRRQKERILQEKRERSSLKRLRSPVRVEE